jgi:hypothetical protein
MKVFKIVVVIMAMVLGFASAENPSEIRTAKEAPWLQIDKSQVPMDELLPSSPGVCDESVKDVTREAAKSANFQKREEIPGEENSQILWGTDVLIRSGNYNLRWLSTSHAADMPNKRTYVTILRRISDVDDTVLHYYSDDGLNWSEWYHVHYPAGNEIWQTEVLVGRGTNPWIYTFMRSTVQGSANSGALILRRMKADASTWNWIYIAQPGDSIRRFAVDMDENEVLYLAYERILPSGNIQIYAMNSIDSGLTWSSPVSISSGNRRDPEIAIGKGNYLYITYVVNDSILRIGRNTNGLSGTWAFIDVQTDSELEYTPSIAASRLQTPPNQTAWVLYRHRHPSAYDVHYAYTTDGGNSWTYSVWPPMNYNYGDIQYPWVETSIDYPVDICAALGTSYSGYDSIVTAWAYASDPTNWRGRAVVNDHNATGEFGSRVDLNYSRGGTTVTYREYGSGNVWFDYWFNTSVVENNNSLKNSIFSKSRLVNIEFTLSSEKTLELNVFNASGRKVTSLEKHFQSGLNTVEIELPSKGIYFINIDNKTIKIVVAD